MYYNEIGVRLKTKIFVVVEKDYWLEHSYNLSPLSTQKLLVHRTNHFSAFITFCSVCYFHICYLKLLQNRPLHCLLSRGY